MNRDTPLSAPLPVDLFYHENGNNRQLHMRVSFKISDSLYIPMSFILDTGAPMYFYLTRESSALLRTYRLVCKDDSDKEHLTIHYKHNDGSDRTFDTPVETIADAPNIMGLSVLMLLGLQLSQDDVFFNNKFEWL